MEVTKQAGDDLPKGASGAAFMIFAPAEDEEEAVRAATKLFKEAGLSPLEVTSYGTIEQRIAEGFEFSSEELQLADEAVSQDAIIILDKQVFFGDDDFGGRN